MDKHWIKQSDHSLFDISSGSTILIKFHGAHNGITADDGSTVDLSWARADGIIFATSGCYGELDIKEWMPIPPEKNHE